MNDNLLPLFLLCFVGSVLGLLGGLSLFLSKKIANIFSKYGIALAAGVLLATTFLDLLPHAVEEAGEASFGIILIVFILFFFIEKFFFHLHHHNNEKSREEHSNSAYLVVVGDTIHNFLDGVAIAASFLVSPALGTTVAIATFLHELPHEVADFSILLARGWKRINVLLTNLFSSLATFAGAIVAIFFENRVESFSGALIAVAAGLFLYIATTDFLPDIVKHDEQNKTNIKFSVFLIGIMVVALLSILVPEVSHE